MSEYLLRSFDEKAVGHTFGLVERDGQRLRFGFAAQLLGRIPVGHPGIERIEYDVAAVWVVELLHELAGGVIDDGAVAARIHLIEHLANDARFAGPGVADDQESAYFRRRAGCATGASSRWW